MPFSDEMFECYEMIKEHFENDFEFSHAGDEDNQQNILADIIRPIYYADIVLADLTELNPNVMYEFGIAHSFNKKTIIITRDDLNTLPFDLKQYRAKNYSTHFTHFHNLIEYLEKNLHGAVNDSVVFSNPVIDFLDKNQIKPQNLFNSNDYALDIPDSEKGFLDFLSDIEEDAIKLETEINSMASEMETMHSGLDTCTTEIKRVSGNSSASFARKQTKKAAEYISIFSKGLKEHNSNIQTLWTKLEKNTLGLLENKYSYEGNNKESLQEYLSSLSDMKNAIIESNESIFEFKDSSQSIIGIERSMNQSIRFLNEDLSEYISMTEQIVKSIERIFERSKFIIG